MSVRHFTNPFNDYVKDEPVFVDEIMIRKLIKKYVIEIIKGTPLGPQQPDSGTLYVGLAGLFQFQINNIYFK